MSVSVLNVSDVRGMVERRRAEFSDVFFEALNSEIAAAVEVGLDWVDVISYPGFGSVAVGDGHGHVVEVPLSVSLFDFLGGVKDTVRDAGFMVDFEDDYSFQVSWVGLM